ncbi:hypothetical protein GCM10009775_04550 [Microbacterium aoyamense]|uniref:Uncharacterized protein n=1 Tax=Microbacterium aoyamense TaxID=344166 RepID=A0ABP5AIZ0_9MICO|nr:hypothetical protein [Microbacterium aoyamense]
MTLTAKTCACGGSMIPSRNPALRICTHCDMPAIHKASTCESCRRLKLTR